MKQTIKIKQIPWNIQMRTTCLIIFSSNHWIDTLIPSSHRRALNFFLYFCAKICNSQSNCKYFSIHSSLFKLESFTGDCITISGSHAASLDFTLEALGDESDYITSIRPWILILLTVTSISMLSWWSLLYYIPHRHCPNIY